jgi:anion-transporting  ArsA/GET3 family ATPase
MGANADAHAADTKSLIRPGQLAAELVDVSRTIRELQAMLRDASQTRFLVVTRAAEVPRFETERLLDRLRRLKLAAPAIVVNAMTLAPGRCRRCRAVAAAEQRSSPHYAGAAVVFAPVRYHPDPVVGAAARRPRARPVGRTMGDGSWRPLVTVASEEMPKPSATTSTA